MGVSVFICFFLNVWFRICLVYWVGLCLFRFLVSLFWYLFCIFLFYSDVACVVLVNC